jgi:transcriptional regulator with XRE-family HTH domain
MPRKSLTPEDWEAIRAEYESGHLTLQQIAEQFGISHNAILTKKKRDEKAGRPWPKRGKSLAVVTKISANVTDVTTSETLSEHVPINKDSKGYLFAFERVLRVILLSRERVARMHKRQAKLNALFEKLIGEADLAPLGKMDQGNKPLTPRTVEVLSKIQERLVRTEVDILKTERLVFGLSNDIPSEPDMLTDENILHLLELVEVAKRS